MVDDEGSVAPRRSAATVHTVRAAIVVVCFVVATVLLLGPAGDLVAGSPTGTTHPTAPPPPVQKSTTTVQVANGTTAAGKAENYTQQLGKLGWDTLPAVDVTPAPTAATQTTTTWIYFLPNKQPAAQEVAAELGVPSAHVSLRTHAVEHEVANASHVDVTVILGTDLAH